MRGTIVIGEMHRERDSSERYAVTVDLWEHYGEMRMRNMGHLSDPVFLPNNKGPGMLIAGYQRESQHIDGMLVIKEHRIVWQVVPISDGEWEE